MARWAAVSVERDGYHTVIIDGERVVSFSDTLRDGTDDACTDELTVKRLRDAEVTHIDIWGGEEAGLVTVLRDAGFAVKWTRMLSMEEAEAWYTAHPEALARR